jgi:hypothetical protein
MGEMRTRRVSGVGELNALTSFLDCEMVTYTTALVDGRWTITVLESSVDMVRGFHHGWLAHEDEADREELFKLQGDEDG